jgi:PAS domain-containing protein
MISTRLVEIIFTLIDAPRWLGINPESTHPCPAGQSSLRSRVCTQPLERFIQQFKATSDVVIDSWFICDNDRNIVDYNRAFFSLFPRPEARQLKAKKCHEVMRLDDLPRALHCPAVLARGPAGASRRDRRQADRPA